MLFLEITIKPNASNELSVVIQSNKNPGLNTLLMPWLLQTFWMKLQKFQLAKVFLNSANFPFLYKSTHQSPTTTCLEQLIDQFSGPVKTKEIFQIFFKKSDPSTLFPISFNLYTTHPAPFLSLFHSLSLVIFQSDLVLHNLEL